MQDVSVPGMSESAESPSRLVRLFRNGANQAVRIPREFEFPGSEALIHKVGDTLIIEPVPVEFPRGSPQAFLQGLDEIARLGSCDDEFPNIDDDDSLLPLDDVVL